MQKTHPITTRTATPSVRQLKDNSAPSAPNHTSDLANGIGNLLNQIPAQQRLQAFQSVVNLASEALNLYQVHKQTQVSLAEYERDMHLSDNEVRKKLVELQEVIEREKTQREKNRNEHEHRMAVLSQQGEAFDRKMQQVETLIKVYMETGDSQSLAAATQALIQISEV